MRKLLHAVFSEAVIAAINFACAGQAYALAWKGTSVALNTGLVFAFALLGGIWLNRWRREIRNATFALSAAKMLKKYDAENIRITIDGRAYRVGDDGTLLS